MIQPRSENKIDSSKLKDFKSCPRKFFYTHVLGWRSQTPNIHLVFGSAWHEAMEHLLLHGYSDTEVLRAFDKFLACYRKDLPPETDGMFKAKTVDAAFWTLSQYVNFPDHQRDLETHEVLHTEIAGSVAVDENRSLYFRQDAILKNRKTEKIRSREHKTGSRTWMWEEQWLLSGQIGTYNHVLYCLFPRESVEGVEMNGSFFLNRKSPPKPEDIFRRILIRKNKSQMQTWLDNTRYYLWEIDREYQLLKNAKEGDPTLFAFPLRDTSCLDYGRVCEFHDFCMAWPNPLQKCFEPPMGFKEEFWDPTMKLANKTFEFGRPEY